MKKTIFTQFIILILIFSYFYFKFILPGNFLYGSYSTNKDDVWTSNVEAKYFLTESFRKREWPLWTPQLYNGYPALAGGSIGTFYIPNLVLFKFFSFESAYLINLILAFFLGELGIYLLLKYHQLSNTSCLYGAIIFILSGFFGINIAQLDLIQASFLIPLILLATYKLLSKGNFSYSLLLAFLLNQQFFTGAYQITFITFISIILIWVALFKDSSIKKTVFLLTSIVLMLFFSAIQLLPTLELWQITGRIGGLSFEKVTSGSYSLSHFASILNLGLLPYLFIIFAVFRFKNKLIRTYLIIAFLSLLLTFGGNSPLYFVFSFPFFNLFTNPSIFIVLTIFSLSILSAIGAEHIRSKYSFLYPSILLLIIFAIAGEYINFDQAVSKSLALNKQDLLPTKQKNVSELEGILPIRTYTLLHALNTATMSSLPRSYIASKTTKIETLEAAYNILKSENGKEGQNVLVEDDLLMNNDKLLVFEENFYPDWKAYIDGKESEIYKVNLSQRGILAPSVDHNVTFAYEPSSFKRGKNITVLFWIITFLTVFLHSFSSHRKV